MVLRIMTLYYPVFYMVENDISHEIEDWIVLSQLWFYWIQNVSETLCK